MNPVTILICLGIYFCVILVVSFITGYKSGDETFYNADHTSKWYIVAFGLIGTSVSGVSLISVTGMVAKDHWTYMQTVVGYLLGYLVITYILLPLYYRLKLISIYHFLGQRFGDYTRKTGSFVFILSRSLGAAARLYLAVIVMNALVFSELGVPFPVTILIILGLIFLYTFQSGIKTIIWTDTLQSALLLAGIVVSIYTLQDLIQLPFSTIHQKISEYGFNEVFTGSYGQTIKNVLSGMFICITMTGLDQGMMQRSLSCPNLKDAQKNILSFSAVLVLVNVLFLFLGAMLALYISDLNLAIEHSDLAFPEIASQHFPVLPAVLFIMAMIAATFSSADDALTALTTSFCIDILKLDLHAPGARIKRTAVHLGFAALIFFIIVFYFRDSKDAVIKMVLNIASITYAPLLGLFVFGIFTKRKVEDVTAAVISIISPIIIIISLGIAGFEKFAGDIITWTDLFNLNILLALVFKMVGNEIIIYIALLMIALLYISTSFKPGTWDDKTEKI